MPSLADMVKARLEKEPQVPIQEKVTQGSKKILSVKNIENQETKLERHEKDTKTEFNKSIELNSIKTIYANRFGSSTNMTLAQMKRKIKNVWK